MRMLRGYALQIRPDFSAGYNEASHSGCAVTRNSRRSRFPFGRIGFQITLRKAIHTLIVLNIQLVENLRSQTLFLGWRCPRWFVGRRKSGGPYFRTSGRRHPSCVDLKRRLPSDDIARSVSILSLARITRISFKEISRNLIWKARAAAVGRFVVVGRSSFLAAWIFLRDRTTTLGNSTAQKFTFSCFICATTPR